MIPERLISQIKCMFGSSSDGVYIKDENFYYRYVNQSTLNDIQLHEEEMLLKLDSELHVAQYAVHYNEHDLAAMQGNIYYQLDDTCTKKGEHLFSLSQKFPLKDEAGKTHGVLAFAKLLKYDQLVNVLSSLSYDNNINIVIDKELVISKHIDLSNRETDVLYHFLYGKSAKTTAELLGITERTVIFHINNIKEKWGCNSKEDVFKKAVEKGLVQFPDLWNALSAYALSV